MIVCVREPISFCTLTKARTLSFKFVIMYYIWKTRHRQNEILQSRGGPFIVFYDIERVKTHAVCFFQFFNSLLALTSNLFFIFGVSHTKRWWTLEPASSYTIANRWIVKNFTGKILILSKFKKGLEWLFMPAWLCDYASQITLKINKWSAWERLK